MHPAVQSATLADLLAVADEKPYYELLDGELSQKAVPLFRHGRLQPRLANQLIRHFGDDAADDEPGGWWIGTEVHVQLPTGDVVVPDVVGWRIDRVPDPPEDFPVKIRPDWICEVISPSNPSRDTIRKLQIYHRAEVPHYWLADPEQQSLTVLRWQPEGYLVALAAEPPAQARPEPFDAVEYSVAALLGVARPWRATPFAPQRHVSEDRRGERSSIASSHRIHVTTS